METIKQHYIKPDEIFVGPILERYYNSQPGSKEEERMILSRVIAPKDNRRLFTFKWGWIVLSIFPYRDAYCLNVDSVYIDVKSAFKGKDLWEDVKSLAKSMKMKYIVMDSKRNSKAWERAYGFKVRSKKMEVEL
jgi:hypothetical protein